MHCHFKLILSCFALSFLLLMQSGCATNWQTATLAGGVTAAGAYAPSHEIEQIYYLGVFDPQEQIPPQIYRVKVHGQASFISLTKFATGWVPAEVADSLNIQLEHDENGKLIYMKQDKQQSSFSLQTGRRLVLFGPEGFREAPRNHRLVILMGTNPSKYFGAVKEVLNQAQKNSLQQNNDEISSKILAALTRIEDEKDQLKQLNNDTHN
jgi:hypothetical protein